MKNLNLKTCSKEQLKSSFAGVLKNLKNNTYVYLEDVYTDKPTILYKPVSYNNTGINAVAELTVNDGVMNRINDSVEPYTDTLDNIINDLWEYIGKVYR